MKEFDECPRCFETHLGLVAITKYGETEPLWYGYECEHCGWCSPFYSALYDTVTPEEAHRRQGLNP